MSRNLAKLLDKHEEEVAKDLSVLEEQCGFSSEDIRLMAENKHKLRSKIEQLGLDANDTTDEELYHALQARFERDSQILDKALGVDDSTKLSERLNKAIQLVKHCASTDEVWVVKNAVAKATLVKYPPKRVARRLHYRSVASMIKRQDISEIFLAGSVLESATWQRNVAKNLPKLSASQYELRPAKIINLKAEHWRGLKGPQSHFVINQQIGVVSVWPSEELNQASVLCLTLLLLAGLHSLNPKGYSEALHELSPGLGWWADTEHLISDDEQPVSLNLKDVSLNHLKHHELIEAVRHHGAHSLWSELMARYRRIAGSLSDRAPDIQYNFSHDELAVLPTNADLAEEYAGPE